MIKREFELRLAQLIRDVAADHARDNPLLTPADVASWTARAFTIRGAFIRSVVLGLPLK